MTHDARQVLVVRGGVRAVIARRVRRRTYSEIVQNTSTRRAGRARSSRASWRRHDVGARAARRARPRSLRPRNTAWASATGPSRGPRPRGEVARTGRGERRPHRPRVVAPGVLFGGGASPPPTLSDSTSTRHARGRSHGHRVPTSAGGRHGAHHGASTPSSSTRGVPRARPTAVLERAATTYRLPTHMDDGLVIASRSPRSRRRSARSVLSRCGRSRLCGRRALVHKPSGAAPSSSSTPGSCAGVGDQVSRPPASPGSSSYLQGGRPLFERLEGITEPETSARRSASGLEYSRRPGGIEDPASWCRAPLPDVSSRHDEAPESRAPKSRGCRDMKLRGSSRSACSQGRGAAVGTEIACPRVGGQPFPARPPAVPPPREVTTRRWRPPRPRDRTGEVRAAGSSATSGRRSRSSPTSAASGDGRRADHATDYIRAVTSEDAMTRTGPGCLRPVEAVERIINEGTASTAA